MSDTRQIIRQQRPCLSRHPDPFAATNICHRCWQHVNDKRYQEIWGLPDAKQDNLVVIPPKATGLGDMVEHALSSVGITQDRVRTWLGDCGCTGRKERLNILGSWAVRVFASSLSEARNEIEKLLG